MAKDPLLRDAVKALKQKIQTAADSASPEELAYLGAAIDRIGGRATVLEVEEMGDVKIAEIIEHAANVEKSTLNSINSTKNAAENSVNTTKNAAVKVMGDTETATVTTVRTAAQTAVTQSETTRDQCVATVTSTAQAAANSVTQQLVLGRKTFFFGQLQEKTMSILGTALPTANAVATLYTVPAGKRAVVNVSLCNRGNSMARVSLAVTTSATPKDSEYIEFSCPLPFAEVLERTAISIAAGQKITAMSTTGTVACNVWGIEEVA